MYSRLQELITTRATAAPDALENPPRINKHTTDKSFLKEFSVPKTIPIKSRIQAASGNKKLRNCLHKKQNTNYRTTNDTTQALLGKNTSSPSKEERDLTLQIKITQARALSTTIR